MIAGIINGKFVYDAGLPILQRNNTKLFIQEVNHDCSHQTHQLLRRRHRGRQQLLARTLRRPRRLRSGSAGLIMHPLEYVTIALAVVAVAARVAMFLPRPPKGPFKAM